MNVTFNGWAESGEGFLTKKQKTLDGKKSHARCCPKEGSLCLFKGRRVGSG